MEWKETHKDYFTGTAGRLYLECYKVGTGGWKLDFNELTKKLKAKTADAAKAEAVAIVRKWCQDILADLGD